MCFFTEQCSLLATSQIDPALRNTTACSSEKDFSIKDFHWFSTVFLCLAMLTFVMKILLKIIFRDSKSSFLKNAAVNYGNGKDKQEMVEKVGRFVIRMSDSHKLYRFVKSCLFLISQAALIGLIAYILSSLVMQGNLIDYGYSAIVSFYKSGRIYNTMCSFFPVTFQCTIKAYSVVGRTKTIVENSGLCSFIYNLVNAQVLLGVWTYFGLLFVSIAYYFVWSTIKSTAWERRNRIKCK